MRSRGGFTQDIDMWQKGALLAKLSKSNSNIGKKGSTKSIRSLVRFLEAMKSLGKHDQAYVIAINLL